MCCVCALVQVYVFVTVIMMYVYVVCTREKKMKENWFQKNTSFDFYTKTYADLKKCQKSWKIGKLSIFATKCGFKFSEQENFVFCSFSKFTSQDFEINICLIISMKQQRRQKHDDTSASRSWNLAFQKKNDSRRKWTVTTMCKDWRRKNEKYKTVFWWLGLYLYLCVRAYVCSSINVLFCNVYVKSI